MGKTKKRKEIWIESCLHGNRTRTLTIGSDWGCCSGFKRAECKKLFNIISEAIKAEFPTAVINPWSDEPHGIPDFD